jgi:hypothetical protein
MDDRKFYQQRLRALFPGDDFGAVARPTSLQIESRSVNHRNSVSLRVGVVLSPLALGCASLAMSSVCFLSVLLPYRTFSFVPRILFPWSYSPKAFLLWIAACVALSVYAGIKGSRFWLLGAGWSIFVLVFAMSAAL